MSLFVTEPEGLPCSPALSRNTSVTLPKRPQLFCVGVRAILSALGLTLPRQMLHLAGGGFDGEPFGRRKFCA